MSTIKNETESTIWVLSDNGEDIWHLSELLPNGVCTTGQPNQRQFESEAKAIAEIPEQYRDSES